MQRKLEDQEKQLQETRKVALLERSRQEAYEVTHDVQVDSLPFLTLPLGDQFQKQGQLLCLLRSWKSPGGMTPVLFQDVIAHSELTTDVPLFIRTTLGEVAWSLWFPT